MTSVVTMPGGLQVVWRDGRKIVLVEMLDRDDGVSVVNFPSIMIVDYDMPSGDRHKIFSGDADGSLSKLKAGLLFMDTQWEEFGLPVGPALWRIHKTAGGYHAFRMDKPVPAGVAAADLLSASVCDRRYASLVRNTKYWPVRVSKKTEREDRVYSIVDAEFGEGTACAECQYQITAYENLVARSCNG